MWSRKLKIVDSSKVHDLTSPKNWLDFLKKA